MRVLITSGGGAKGAFSVGALQHLNDRGIKNFDIISGTSTGALIAAMATVGRVDILLDVYRNTQNEDILQPMNLFNNIQAGNPFIFHTHPLMMQIEDKIDENVFQAIKTSPTLLCLNAVSLQSGTVTVFSNREMRGDAHYDTIIINSRKMLIDALLGSSNQAVFLNPIPINGQQYVDGGNREVVPTRAVMANLNEAEDHEIFVLSNNPVDLIEYPEENYKSILAVLIRAISIFIQEIREGDMEALSNFKEHADGMIKIYYISPVNELDKKFPTGLRFDPASMERWIQEGIKRAKDIMDKDPNGNFPFVTV